MNLRDVLVEAAAPLGVEAIAGPDGAWHWAVAGADFATMDAAGEVATFRLDPVLASAARRTPDVTGSPRGPEWVEFRPTVVDEHAGDRAAAWFAAAARRATG